jgi:hypothetical protein
MLVNQEGLWFKMLRAQYGVEDVRIKEVLQMILFGGGICVMLRMRLEETSFFLDLGKKELCLKFIAGKCLT